MTIRQIAESFGVAPSTVSVVLNNRPGVRSELRQKIRDTLIENGYQIRGEQKSHPGNILFVYYKSTDYLAARKDDTMTSILSGIEQVCTEKSSHLPLPTPLPPHWTRSCSPFPPMYRMELSCLVRSIIRNPAIRFLIFPCHWSFWMAFSRISAKHH